MWRKIFALITVFVFILFAVPFVFVTQLYGTLSDESFYKEDLVDYSYDVLIDELPEKVDLQEFPSITKEDFRELISGVFQAEDFRFIVEDVLDQVKNVKNVQGKVEMKIPLAQLSAKRDLMAEKIADLLYEKLPECSLDPKVGNMEGVKDFQCIPKGLAKIDFQNRIALEIDGGVFAKLPGQYIVGFQLPEQLRGNSLKSIDGAFDLFFIVGLGWLALLLGILALIIRKSWKKVLKWEMGAIFLAFACYFIIMTIFKFFGGVGGIATYYLDMTRTENINLNFGLSLIDFVLDRAVLGIWVLVVGMVSLILWFVFAVTQNYNDT